MRPIQIKWAKGLLFQMLFAVSFAFVAAATAQADPIKLYWTDNHTDIIERSDPDGTPPSREVLVTPQDATNQRALRGIVVDAAGNKIYWADEIFESQENGVVRRANLDGTLVEDVATGLANPRGVALDLIARKVYWTAGTRDLPGLAKIQRADMDGLNSNVEDLVIGSTSLELGLDLDLQAGNMYWVELGGQQVSTGKIYRADMTGDFSVPLSQGNLTPLVQGLGMPIDLVLDLANAKMYWTESLPTAPKIQRANLDGTNVENIPISGISPEPTGLEIDSSDQKLYVSVGVPAAKIYRLSTDGSGLEEIINTGLIGTQGVALQFSPSATLAAVEDSILRKGNSNRNEGANPRLRVRASGNNRALVAFDSAAIDAFLNAASLTGATLSLTIAENGNNWSTNGRTVDAHPLLEDFTEGNGQNAGVPGSQSTRGNGPGVTWNCAVDDEISNQQPDCSLQWNGGNFGPATAPPVLHTNGLLGEVTWDVTDDVLAGVTTWLIKKTDEGPSGKALYYSIEGANDHGDPNLAPTLVLE